MELNLTHGNVFVWNADDTRTLREKYRIVGTLIGCLPRAPRQNVHLGLPLQLMPEETQLLLDKGYAELVDGDRFNDPDEKKVDAFKQMRKESYEAQIELFRQERKQEIYRNMNKIVEGKRAKTRKLMAKQQLPPSNRDEEAEQPFDVESIPIGAIAEENSIIQLFTASPWEDECSVASDKWTYPETDRERLRCRVFAHLWDKGYYLTGGGKFGGDFLVYPGDPSRYHSFYIAICKPHDEKLTGLDIISMGRLGSNVKKTVLLCSVDSSSKVVCTSLQWTGIS